MKVGETVRVVFPGTTQLAELRICGFKKSGCVLVEWLSGPLAKKGPRSASIDKDSLKEMRREAEKKSKETEK